jgi:hypothetical protein
VVWRWCWSPPTLRQNARANMYFVTKRNVSKTSPPRRFDVEVRKSVGLLFEEATICNTHENGGLGTRLGVRVRARSWCSKLVCSCRGAQYFELHYRINRFLVHVYMVHSSPVLYSIRPSITSTSIPYHSHQLTAPPPSHIPKTQLHLSDHAPLPRPHARQPRPRSRSSHARVHRCHRSASRCIRPF